MVEDEHLFPNNKVIQNPEKFISMINNYVNVTTKYNITLSGYLSAVDPLSESLILTNVVNDKTNTSVVLGHSIREINLREAPSDVKPMTKIEKVVVVKIDEHRKTEILNWLLKNLLPVEEKDDNLYIRGNQVIIQPPYRPEDCISTNPIVLGRIQHLIRSMPIIATDPKISD